MKKVLDEIDQWKASELDIKIRNNIENGKNSFGLIQTQYQARATKYAKQFYELTGEPFKI